MRVIVACGGTSTEREVSLRSGAAVAEALRASGEDAFCVDVQSIRVFLEQWSSWKADGVFVALHGGWGEDGRFQAALEAWGIPYTGSGPAACLLAMDKEVSKILFHEAGIPIAPGVTLNKSEHNEVLPEDWLREWGSVVLKPCCGGSTIGVTFARTEREVWDGLDRAFQLDNRVIVEKFIEGTELTVAVCENEQGPHALPVIEMRPHSGFYDYESKYTQGSTEYLCPAPIEDAFASQLGKIAVQAHTRLGCEVYSRVDFRVSSEGKPYILEVNTAPGMTETSLVPKAAVAAGLDFSALLHRIINTSFEINRFEI